MADTRGLTLALALTVRVAVAAPPCEEDRGQTGLALSAGDVGLSVTVVAEGSKGDVAGMRPGDGVLQVNGIVPRGCSDWARAVREARRDRKALLVFVRRAGTDVPLVLGPGTWEVVVSTPPPTLPTPAPSVRPLVTATPPPSLPPVTQGSVDEVLRELAALTPAGDRPPRATGLDTYRGALRRVRAQVSGMTTGEGSASPVTGGLTTVLAYHEAAAVAWATDDTEGQRTHRPRQLPASDHVAPYYADSESAGVIAAFPFLGGTVVREPAPGMFGAEAAGVWRPLAARALLWEHARVELTLLTAWLAGRGS